MRNDGDGGPGRLRKGEFAEILRTAHARRIPSSAQAMTRELSNPMIECMLPLGGEAVSHIYVGPGVGCVRPCFGAPSGSRVPNVSHNEYHEHCRVGSRTAYTHGNGSEVPNTRGAKVIRGSSASSCSAASDLRESGPMACGRSARPMGCFGALSNRRSRIGGPRAQLAHGQYGT